MSFLTAQQQEKWQLMTLVDAQCHLLDLIKHENAPFKTWSKLCEQSHQSPLDCFLVPIDISEILMDENQELLKLCRDQQKQFMYIQEKARGSVSAPPSDDDPTVQTVLDRKGNPVMKKGNMQTFNIPIPSSPTQMGFTLAFPKNDFVTIDDQTIVTLKDSSINKRFAALGPIDTNHSQFEWVADQALLFKKTLIVLIKNNDLAQLKLALQAIKPEIPHVVFSFGDQIREVQNVVQEILQWRSNQVYFSIDGRVTFNENENFFVSLFKNKMLGPHQLITQTCSPFMLTRPCIDQQITVSIPHHVGFIVEAIARLLSDETSSIAQQIRMNFYNVFNDL